MCKLGFHLSEEHKKKLSEAHMNKKLSVQHKNNISKSMIGKNIWMKGKSAYNKGIPMTEEQKKKISGKKNHGWKGGKKLAQIRRNQKRRQRGFIPLNYPEIDGWVGHHLDYNYVIFIPEELHKSIYHSVTKDINMDLINDKVYGWFVEYYFKGEL